MKIKLNYFSFVCALFGIFFIFTNTASADLSDGLILHHQYNGNAFDSSGNDNHGTVYGATLVSDRFCNSNSAYEFDKNDDYVEVPHSSSLNVGTGNFSFSFWVKITDSNDWMVLLDKRDPSANWVGYSIYIQNKRPQMQIYYNSASYYYTTQTLTANTWAHVVVIVDRINSSSGKFFINGVLSATFDATDKDDNINNTQNLIIGKYVANNSYSYGGGLNYLRLYNRALSTAEAQELYSYENEQHFELKGVASIADMDSSGYSEILNLMKSAEGTFVKIIDSHDGDVIDTFPVFSSAWTPTGITVLNVDGVGADDIAVSGYNVADDEVIIRTFENDGTKIGTDIDLLN